jgi:hypothetical protein
MTQNRRTAMNKLTLTTLLLGLGIAAAPAAMADSYRDRDYRGERHGPRLERKRDMHHDKWRAERRHERAGRHREGFRRGEGHGYRDWRHARRHAWREERRAWRHDRGHGFGYAPRYGYPARGYHGRYHSSGRHDRTLPIIAGGVIGGLVGSDLGHGDPGAATRGLIVGSVLGYALSH